MIGRVDRGEGGSEERTPAGGAGKWESWISWPLQELVLTEFRGDGGEEVKYGLMREENRLRVRSG